MMIQSNTKAPRNGISGGFLYGACLCYRLYGLPFGELSEVSYVYRGLHVAIHTVSKRDWRTMVFKFKTIR